MSKPGKFCSDHIVIREESPADYAQVEAVIEQAFKSVTISDQTEHFLVNRLRKSDAFIPQLSLVAEIGNDIIGHILLSKVKIQKPESTYVSLSLAPVSVLPAFQKQGIGSALIRRSHDIAANLNFKTIVLIGHRDYYPRFGYEQASDHGISFPFEVPEENCMVKFLVACHASGNVIYPSAFFA